MGTPTASPNNHRSKLPPAKAEDLGSVLERFENWVGKQQNAVRELSYAEAIARSRRRHPQTDLDDTGPEIATPPTAQEGAAATAAPTPAVSPAATVSKTSAPPASKPARAATKSQPATASLPREGVSVSKAGMRGTAAKPAPEKTGASHPAKRAAAQPEKAATAQPEKEKTAAPAVDAKKSVEKSARKAAKTIANPAGLPKPAATPKAATTPKAVAEPPQPATFQQALAAQLAKSQATIPAETAIPANREASSSAEEKNATVSLSVSMTSAEHARIQERAAQLGLTPDAYLRQCVWEVESLRTEVQKLLLARMQAGPRKLAPVPKSSWLSRLKRYFFRRRDRQGEVIHA
jgi:hypothetical protein